MFFRTISVLALCTSTSALANEAMDLSPINVSLTKKIGAAERIEAGDFLRVYSQEVAAAACFYHNDVDAALSQELLIEARDGFRLKLDALRNGNTELGIIGSEKRKKTIVKLDQVQTTWAEIDAAVAALLEDKADTTAIDVIKSQNLALLKMTELLLSELEGQYANPTELMLADVMMLEIAGRQSMLTQKIAKNACKLLSGRDTDKVRADLEEAVATYELSLNALINGMPEIGLKAAPTEDIAAGLKAVQKDWADTRITIDAILDGSRDPGQLEYLFRHMADEMHKLEEITHQYVVYSKHEY